MLKNKPLMKFFNTDRDIETLKEALKADTEKANDLHANMVNDVFKKIKFIVDLDLLEEDVNSDTDSVWKRIHIGKNL